MFFDDLFNDYDPFDGYSYRQQRPQTASMFRNDNRSIILRKLLNDEYNYMCFDCHRELRDLDYFDLKNGIFLCHNCAQEHAKLPREISQPMTGNIQSLEENDLLLLYYGGNQNLFEFIRRHFPLLENMKISCMYSTKAMDYYRKLLRSKAYDEPEPEMPGKKKAYNSIYRNTKPINEPKTLRARRMRNDDDDNIFSETFFGDDLFNKNRRNQREKERKAEEDAYFGSEPADVKNEESENDDAGMKIEKNIHNSHISHENKVEKEKEEKQQQRYYEPKTERKINREPKYKKIEKKQKIVEENKTPSSDSTSSTLTINQIGELDMYPDAMEIDGMDCE